LCRTHLTSRQERGDLCCRFSAQTYVLS